MDTENIGQPDPLRIKVFANPAITGPSVEERLGYLVEFVAAMDDRLKEVENLVTDLVTQDVKPDA